MEVNTRAFIEQIKTIRKNMMADTEKNTETKTTAKPKTTAKAKPEAAAKAKPKTKPKAKAKPKAKPKPKAETKTTAKAEPKSKATPVDAAPYLQKNNTTKSSGAGSESNKSSTPLILLVAVAIIIITTIYKFDEELNSMPTQTEAQEVIAITTPPEEMLIQTNLDSVIVDTETTQTDEPAENINEMILQQQLHEKEMQSRLQQHWHHRETPLPAHPSPAIDATCAQQLLT